MKVFKTFNTETQEPCPICLTKDEKETVCIAKHGTQEGYNVQCIQVHLSCLDLWYDSEHQLIYQSF